MSNAKLEGSVRDRLLAAASELFYDEGVHTVGIDRVLARAGVAKASLYSTFGSKDELVRAYLQARADARQRRISERIARHDDPREQILSIFDLLGELAARPTFRGCPFINASAEGRRDESSVAQVSAESRGWLRDLFARLAGEAGAADPATLGRQLAVLYDGAIVSASMDRDPGAVAAARAVAASLLDAQASSPAPARRRARAARAGGSSR